MQLTTHPKHVRQVLISQNGFEEDQKEILALLRFVKKPMSAKEISEANDISLARVKRLLDDLVAKRELRTSIEGARVVFIPD